MKSKQGFRRITGEWSVQRRKTGVLHTGQYRMVLLSSVFVREWTVLSMSMNDDLCAGFCVGVCCPAATLAHKLTHTHTSHRLGHIHTCVPGRWTQLCAITRLLTDFLCLFSDRSLQCLFFFTFLLDVRYLSSTVYCVKTSSYSSHGGLDFRYSLHDWYFRNRWKMQTLTSFTQLKVYIRQCWLNCLDWCLAKIFQS